MSARHREQDDAWFDHIQELRWLNECEDESKNESEDEYVSEYAPENQEEEDYGVEDQDQDQERYIAEELAIFEEAWFNHVQENSWTSGCENEEQSSRMFVEDQSSRMFVEDQSSRMFVEDQSSRMFVEDQEQEESAYRELEILEEAWFSHVQENHWTNGCENEDQEQDISGNSCADKSPSIIYHKQRAADMEAKVMELEARLLLEEAWLMEAEASAAAAKARTLELEGLLEKQNKQIDELTESLDMMTAWVIAVVRPETTNCLSSS
jgi:hypothetical protein